MKLSIVIPTFKEARGEVVGVMDADLSHPPETVVRLVGLEVLARGRYRKAVEVPYVFTDRRRGSSKFRPVIG